MHSLTEAHAQRLEDKAIQDFVDATVLDVIDMAIETVYPKQKETLDALVKKAIDQAKEYGLVTEKDVYVFVVAWYLLGDALFEREWLMTILKDPEVYASEKREALHVAIDVYLDKMAETKEVAHA